MTKNKTEVIINGVKYLPAKEVILNSKQIKKALIDLWWGNSSDDTIAKYENDVYIEVTDEPIYSNPITVKDFVEGLNLED